MVFIYSIIVVFSSLVNIFFQRMTLEIYPSLLVLAMLMGTGTGFLAKYLLDAKFIFKYRPKSLNDQVKVATKYGLMSVFTTLIFWGTELSFHHFVPMPESALWGAALGLTIGNLIKYRLDKKYVFTTEAFS